MNKKKADAVLKEEVVPSQTAEIDLTHEPFEEKCATHSQEAQQKVGMIKTSS